MRYRIHHVTRYEYSAPVFLEQHVLRLKPVTNATQRLESFDQTIDPQPQSCTGLVDVEGNDTLAVWFGAMTDHLTLDSTSVVQTLRSNPFDYLWEGSRQLPIAYAAGIEAVLAPYRDASGLQELRELATEMSSLAHGNAQTFLSVLTREMHARFPQTVRVTGDALPAIETLRSGEGSCRDLTMLFMAVAREQGFAARFVSGYQAQPDADDELAPHAWAEVYVPGGGWRGYDPTMGLAVADRHIAVAFGAEPQRAALVSGSLRGSASARFTASLTIEALDG